MRNLWIRLRLRKFLKNDTEMWTKSNLIYFLINNGMHLMPIPTDNPIEYKWRLVRAYEETLSNKQLLILANTFGFKFKLYPYGGSLFWRLKSETKSTHGKQRHELS